MRRPPRSNRRMDDDWYEEPFFFMGIGSLHDLQGPDPRNPRLAGLKSVSYNAAVALRKADAPRPTIGFHRPKR